MKQVRITNLDDLKTGNIPDAVILNTFRQVHEAGRILMDRGCFITHARPGEPLGLAATRATEIADGKQVVVIDAPDPGAREYTGMVGGTELDLKVLLDGGIKGQFMPPLYRKASDTKATIKSHGVKLEHTIVWRDERPSAEGFMHEQTVGEHLQFHYGCTVHCKPAGDWDARTPILHSALAGLDVTSAGFDEAYLRSLGALEVLITGRRDEFTTWARSLVGRYVKRKFHPFRFLVRGAVLWAALTIEEQNGEPAPRHWLSAGQRPNPKNMGTAGAFGQFCREQMAEPTDVVYVRCETMADSYMVDVMQALCSDVFPIQSNVAVGKVWPSLHKPRVIYSAPDVVHEFGAPITSDDVFDSMNRFCDVHDCHDLFEQALQFVQFFVARPAGTGLLGGINTIIVGMPDSDLSVGVIGPLFAGLTAEGMKSPPLAMPDRTEYLYGAAVRGIMISAAYYEAIIDMNNANPARVAIGAATHRHFKALTNPHYSRNFFRKDVVPRVQAAGWDCIPESLCWIAPVITKNNLGNLLASHRVAWWTLVLPHLRDEGGTLMRHWLTPAGLDRVPDSNKWYACKTFGLTTSEQVAAAVRWLGAEVRYVVDSGSGINRVVNLDAGGYNRFMPLIRPVVQIGHDVARVGVKFPHDIVKRLELVKKIGHCNAELMHKYDETVDHADESLWMETGPEALLPFIMRQGPPDEVPENHLPVEVATVQHNSADAATFKELGEACKLLQPLGLVLDPDWFVAGGAGHGAYVRSGVPWETIESHLTQFGVKNLAYDMDPRVDERLRAINFLATRLIDTAPVDKSTDRLNNMRREAVRALSQAERIHRPNADAKPTRIAYIDKGKARTDEEIALRQIERERRRREYKELIAPDDPTAKTEEPQDFGPTTSAQVSDAPETPAGDVVESMDTEAVVGFVPPGTTSD